MTFGALSLAGGDLTMASIAVLPVLIGLAVDYAIQFQARFDEAGARAASREPAVAAVERRRADDPHRRRGHRGRLPRAAAVARADGARLRRPARGRASRSRSPARCAPASPRSSRFRGRERAGRGRRRALAGALRRSREHPRVHAAREWLADRSWRTLGALAVAPAARARDRASPWPSWGSRSTRRARWSPTCASWCRRTFSAEDVNALQKETGVSGEIDVTIRADDITDPAVIAWMTRFQDGVLNAHGYRPGKRCSAGAQPAGAVPGAVAARPVQHRRQRPGSRCARCSTPCRPTSRRASSPRTGKTANLAFGIRLMPLDRQKEVVDDIKPRLDAARRASRRRWSACRCWPPRRTARSPRPGAARSR